MRLTVLGITMSPRYQANCHRLVEEALAGARAQGAETEHLWLGDFRVGPCTACNFCMSTGQCKIQDDFQGLMRKLLQADRLIVAAPVYFAGLPAQAKALVDRCQCYWAEKHLPNAPSRPGRPSPTAGTLIVSGAETSGPCEGPRLQLAAWFNVLGIVEACRFETGGMKNRDAAGRDDILLGKVYTWGSDLVKSRESSG